MKSLHKADTDVAKNLQDSSVLCKYRCPPYPL